MNFDLACLETFVLLAECGSCSRAARCQTISQPAVSQRIAKLEGTTGLRLFTRQSDGFRLTPDGAALLDIARDILREHDELALRMDRYLRERSGKVRVMLDGSAACDRLAAALRREEDGRRELLRATGSVCWQEALRRQAVDLVVAGNFLHAWDDEAFERHDLLRQDGLTVAWSRDYFDIVAEGLRLDRILRHTWLVPSAILVPGFRAYLETLCAGSHGAAPAEMRECDRDAEAADICMAGLGVLMFPGDFGARVDISRPGIDSMHIFQILLPEAYGISIFSRRGERTPEVVREAHHIRTAFARAGAERAAGVMDA